MVNTDTPLSASDLAVKEHIASLGYNVVARTGAAAVTADAIGKAFVVISSAPLAGSKFRDVTTAVIVWEGSVLSAMNMVGPTSGGHYGTQSGQTQLVIVDPSHPLAGGLNGTRTTSSASDTYTWGWFGFELHGVSPVATFTTVPEDPPYAIFGYEIGAELVSGTAVDRRAGLFLGPNTGTLLTADGKTLLDAAIRWAATSDPDHDGLGTADEYRHGTDPHDADSNDDGVLDGPSVAAGISPTSLDVDGDGLLNAVERAQGTNPFRADTDGDGYTDALIGGLIVDCFPLDPTRWLCPAPVPGDVTPPVITLIEPTNAVLLP